MTKSSNPALGKEVFTKEARLSTNESTMTITGTVNKTFILTLILFVAAAFTWRLFYNTGSFGAYVAVGGIGGFVVALITIFKKSWSAITAPVYAYLEGLFLGGISAMMESVYPGIVIQAVALTFGTLFALLAAYRSGLIKVTENFKLGVAAATGGIAIVYLMSFLLGMFGIQMPMIHESGIVGIGFSLLVVVIASLNLVMDFDFIEHGAQYGAPKYMEWYGAFGLMVTLVWLYIEFLRLLSKLRD